MAEAPLFARSPLDSQARPGRYGASSGATGLVVREISGLAIAGIAARLGKADATAVVLAAAIGATPPDGPRRTAANGIALIGVGPGQWLAAAEGARAEGFVAGLAARLGGFAAVTDQSDSRLVLRLEGPRLRDTLAKGVRVDLHPRVFKPGDAAQTLVAHIGVLITCLDERPTFELMAYRSFAGSLWSWLSASALEYGFEVAAG